MTHTPNTPDELLALQAQSDYLRQMLEMREQLNPSPADDLALAVAIIERHHDGHRDMVQQLTADTTAPRDQLVTWAEDAERLQLALALLQGVEPPCADDDDEVAA
jgi:hypothetical protein